MSNAERPTLMPVLAAYANVRAAARSAHVRPSADGEGPVDINESIRTTLVVAANEYTYVADVNTDLAPLSPVTCSAGDLNPREVA